MSEEFGNFDWKTGLVPARVRYVGLDSGKFLPGKEYEAFFIEYWGEKRNSLHVRGDDGNITDFNPFEEFQILEDKQNLLNHYEAIVKCVTHRHEKGFSDLTFGKDYKAIGRDKDGLFLVKDNSGACYFYPPDDFQVVEDEHGILNKQSMYYSYDPRDKSN